MISSYNENVKQCINKLMADNAGNRISSSESSVTKDNPFGKNSPLALT